MTEKEIRRQKEQRRRAAIKRKKRRRRKKIILGLEVMAIFILVVGVFLADKYGKLDRVVIPDEERQTNEVVKENKDMKKYTNIAFFGVDARDGSLGSGTHSDTIMVASINNKTKDVKLVSIYRDTYLLIPDPDGSFYNKANLGYFYGGPKVAINELNRNLDLDISDYVTVNFNVLIDVIDALGGVDLEITERECFYINGYMTETSKITGKDIEPLDEWGQVHLSGMQATAFCRIRYVPTVNGTEDDYGRTERQRTVLEKLAQKAKNASIGTLNSIVDKILPDVSTSLSVTEILSLAKDAASYNIVGTKGFPFEVVAMDVGKKGSCVVPVDLTHNVEELHKYLFDVETYKVSNEVQEISDKIVEDTGKRYTPPETQAEDNQQ